LFQAAAAAPFGALAYDLRFNVMPRVTAVAGNSLLANSFAVYMPYQQKGVRYKSSTVEEI
jgi:hypothetical protein